MIIEPARIKTNLDFVLEKIGRAAEQSGRLAEDVKLIVVSKKQPLPLIRAGIQAGIRDFGENYPEEAVKKIQTLSDVRIQWHMIGHLQSRKAAVVADHFHFFHALDSIRLGQKLNSILEDRQYTLPVLLEINIGDEESKFGWSAGEDRLWSGFRADIEQILKFNHLVIRGLMIMPPVGLNPEIARPYFRKTRQLRDELCRQFPEIQWSELSMGTSVDFEVAVQEGATMVRIGQAILGPRTNL